MLVEVTESLLKLGMIALMPIVMTGAAQPAFAQASAATITICRYDPNSGLPNVLGMRTYVSLTESEGNTVATLDRFPSFVSSSESPNRRADVGEVRSLTLYDTPIAAARQLLVEQPAYYAALMEIDESEIGEGFAPINETLGCGQVAVEPTPEEAPEKTPEETPENPSTETAEPVTNAMQTASLDLPNLPNGNYRLVSASFPNRVVSEAALADSNSAVFLFRKFGENITGTFQYTGEERNVCISGTVDGNTVVGTAYRRGSDFQENSFLSLGEAVSDTEYAGSTLNLDGFSRINAGRRLPLESCS